MASIGDLFLRLLVDDSDFEKQVVAKAQKAGVKAGQGMGAQMAAGLSQGATAIGGALANVGQNLTQAGTAMTRNLTLPILAAGGAVTKFALDFDTTMRQVVGLTDVTAGEIDGIKEKILALGPAVGKGPQELAEAFYFIASAGFKADEAMQVLEVSAKAAASGLGDTQTIAQVLGGVINAYGRENITAATAADILTEAVSQGTAEASGLANVIGNVVPGAAALGVSFDQVTAAMAGMTLSGVGVEESATSLIQIFSSLQKPTSQAEEALRGMGLSSAELRRQLREEGLLATLRTLEERFAGNETASAAVFGNIRALRGVTALLTLDSTQLNAVFEKVADSTGRMGQAYEETEGPQRDIDKAMADLEATAIQLGTDVLPLVVDVLGKVAAGARELGTWWKSLDKNTRGMIVTALAWLAIAGPTLLIVGKLTSGLGAMLKVVGVLAGAKGIPALTTAAARARLAMGLWAVIFVELTIAAMAAGEAAHDFFNELIHGKKGAKVLAELTALVENEKFANRLKEWGVSVEDFTTVLEAAGGDAEAAFRAIEDASGDVGLALAVLSGGMDKFSDAGGAMAGRLRDKVHRAAEAAAREAEQLPENLAATLIDGAFVVEEAAEVMVDPIAEAVEKAKQSVADAANDLVKTLATSLASNPQELRDAAKAMWEDILHPFPDIKQRLEIEGILANKTLIAGLTSSDSGDRARTAEYIKGLLANYELLAPGALAAGEELNPALRQGIENTLDALTTYLETTTGNIASQFDLADELERMGYDGLASYVRGQEQARIDKIAETAGLILRDTKAAFFDNYYPEGFDAAKTYADGLTAGGAKAITATQYFTGKIKGLLQMRGSPAYTHSREAGEGVGLSYMGQLIGALRDAIPTLTRIIAGVGQSMAFAPSLGALGVPSIGGMAAVAGSAIQSVDSGMRSTVGGAASGASGNTFGDININAPTVPMTGRDIGRELRRTGVFGGTP